MNLVTLAFIGDAVYELAIRHRLAERGGTYTADKLHVEAVRYVKAQAQAKALKGMIKENILSDEELDLVRKARNRKPKSIPRHADPLEYKFASALEALFGWHFTEGRADRVEELVNFAVRVIDEDRQAKR